MVTITPNSWGERLEVALPKAGAYPARLVSIIHQWTTVSKYWPQTQCIMRFELPTELDVFMEGWEEMPHCVNVYVSVSYSKTWAFFGVLEKLWIDTSDDFELEDALGKTCQVSVAHKESNGKTYLNAKHKDIAPLMKGIEVADQYNESRFFWISAEYEMEEWEDEDGKKTYKKKSCKNVSMEGWDDLRDYEKEKISQSWEYKASNSVPTWEDEEERF